jgi:WD40-like Beta Propeller Repeat
LTRFPGVANVAFSAVKIDKTIRLAGLLAAGLALTWLVVSRFSLLTTMPRPLVDLYLDVVGSGVALSPDGKTLAYVVREGEVSLLELRRVGERGTRRHRNTKGAKRPFFPPDGSSLGFSTPPG